MTPKGSPTIVIVSSARDPASANIASALIRRHGFQSTKIMLNSRPLLQKDSSILVTVDSEIVAPPDLDSYFNPKAYVFLSRHYAESGIPAVTVHTTGNFTDTEALGARPREVGRIDPDLQKNYFIALYKRKALIEEYQITVEATHHGPTSLGRPVLFVELGASEKNWVDESAAAVVADSLMEALADGTTWEKVALAFGGTHYPAKINRLLLESDFAVSAVVPKHSLEWVDPGMFGQMIEKTTRFPRYVTVDWKGMGKHKDKIVGLAKQFALEIVKL